MKKILSVLLLLSAGFSLNLTSLNVYVKSPQLAKQLYAESDFSQEYFQFFENFPTIPDLKFQGISDLRTSRANFMVSLVDVKKSEPVGFGSILEWFKHKVGLGYILSINKLLDEQGILFKTSNEFLKRDLHAFFEEESQKENLSYFQSRFELKGRNFFQLENEVFTKTKFEFPTIFESPGCMFEGVYVPQGTVITSPCHPNLFLTPSEKEKMFEGWEKGIDELNHRLSWLTDYFDFLTLAKKYTTERENKWTRACNYLEAKKSEFDEISDVLNDSLVKRALFVVLPSKGLLAREKDSFESPLGFCYEPFPKRLGEKAKFLDEFLQSFENFKIAYSQRVQGINRSIVAMQELCIEYGGNCTFNGKLPSVLKKTSERFVFLRAKYLNETQKALELKYRSALNDVESLLNQVQQYLAPSSVVKYSAQLKDLKERGYTKDALSNLNKLTEDISSEFLTKHWSDARNLKAELLSKAEFLRGRGENVSIRNLELNYDSPISNFVYYLSKESFLDNLQNKYNLLLENYSSNLPSHLNCVPTVPLAGKRFKTVCNVIVENSWGGVLKSAHSLIHFPYPPVSLSAKNFVGDVANLESVSFGDPPKLNLKSVPAILFFKTTYFSELPEVKRACNYVGNTYSCHFYPACNYEFIRVPLIHPFSGKKMNSTAKYTYDGENIFVEIPCKDTVVNFTGPTYEFISDGLKLKVRNLINASAWVHATLDVDKHPVEIGLELKPEETKILPLNAQVTALQNDSISEFNETLDSPINNTVSYLDFLEYLKGPSSFGCVEQSVYSQIHKKYNLPSLRCFDLQTDLARKLYSQNKTGQAFKVYVNATQNTNYLVFRRNSQNYESLARELLSSKSKGVFSILANPYWEKAKLAYENKDYLSSIYYSKFALLKSSIHLGVDWKTLIALLVIGYGIYSTKKNKKEEELI